MNMTLSFYHHNAETPAIIIQLKILYLTPAILLQ